MPVIFILGRPGCGKSEAARYIVTNAQSLGLSTFRVNDYDILQEMFLVEKEPKQFCLIEYANDGFDIVDFTVLDTSLQEAEKRAMEQLDKVKLLIIEFARKDYKEALKHFDPALFHNAHFLYIETDVETCVLRVYERAAHPQTIDDHYVSDEVIKNYYRDDGAIHLISDFVSNYNISADRVRIINNAGSLQDFKHQIFGFINDIFSREMPLLPDTDPAQFVPNLIYDFELPYE